MLKRTPKALQIGPRDMIRADGSIDWQALKMLARPRAVAEFAAIEGFIASGKLPADCATTMAIQNRAAIKHYRARARDLFEAHPANRDKITFHSVTPYGRQCDGVRLSAF